jgi:cardiolipin synthase
MAVATSGRPARSGNSVAGNRHGALNSVSQNLANALTLLRLLCALPLPALIVWGWSWTALGVFVFAALTDVADGYIAKRFNGCSPLGAVLDPMADKLLLGLSFLALLVVGAVAPWLVALILARDLLLALGTLVLRRRVRDFRIEPLVIGKLCTFTQLAYVGVVLAAMAGLAGLADWLTFLELATATVTLGSSAVYLAVAIRLGASSRRAA